MIISVACWALAATFVMIFVGRAWALAPLRAKDTAHVVRAGVDAVVALAVVRALFPPPGWTSWIWVLAVGAVGVGLAGLVLTRTSRPAARRRWPTLVYLALGGGLLAILA